MTQLYLPSSLTNFEEKHMVFSTWVDHMAFGYDLVAAVKPRILVELGTHKGLSFFAFCQSMKEHRIDGMCYGVDTFEGDAHTDKYDESVFNAVQAHARQNYHGIAYLMRMLFNDALAHFSDESVDLLHIDGLHTYEAVSDDFRNWYPKVRPGGIVLFHDVMARMNDFGAWRFWEETSPQHESFTFHHGFGLGVLRKPGGDRSADAELLHLLFDDRSPEAAARLRAFYVHACRALENARKARRLEAQAQSRAAAQAANAAKVPDGA
jgi:hypothetical protein